MSLKTVEGYLKLEDSKGNELAHPLIVMGKKKVRLHDADIISVDYKDTPVDVIEQVNAILKSRKVGFAFTNVNDGSDTYLFVAEATR